MRHGQVVVQLQSRAEGRHRRGILPVAIQSDALVGSQFAAARHQPRGGVVLLGGQVAVRMGLCLLRRLQVLLQE